MPIFQFTVDIFAHLPFWISYHGNKPQFSELGKSHFCGKKICKASYSEFVAEMYLYGFILIFLFSYYWCLVYESYIDFQIYWNKLYIWSNSRVHTSISPFLWLYLNKLCPKSLKFLVTINSIETQALTCQILHFYVFRLQIIVYTRITYL